MSLRAAGEAGVNRAPDLGVSCEQIGQDNEEQKTMESSYGCSVIPVCVDPGGDMHRHCKMIGTNVERRREQGVL